MKKLALIVAVMLIAGPAAAAERIQPRLPIPLPDPLHLNPAAAPAASNATTPLTGVNFNQIGQKLQALAKDVIDKGINDLTAASADADAHHDLVSKPCWDAQITFLKGLPSEQQNPPSEIGPALAIQISRDLMNSITGNDQGSLKVACAALIGDQVNIINQTLALVGIAGIAGLPAGL